MKQTDLFLLIRLIWFPSSFFLPLELWFSMQMLKLVPASHFPVTEQEGMQVVASFGLMQPNPKLKHYERFIAVFGNLIVWFLSRSFVHDDAILYCQKKKKWAYLALTPSSVLL